MYVLVRHKQWRIWGGGDKGARAPGATFRGRQKAKKMERKLVCSM